MSVVIILAALCLVITAQAWIPDEDDETDPEFVDRNGIERRPGQEAREVGLS